MKLIDIHAHILPGVDDGARNWEESLAMAQAAYSQGFKHIYATPHHSRRRGTEGLLELAGELQARAAVQAPDLRISLGEELYYYEGIVEELKQGKALTLGAGRGRFALVEFEPAISYDAMYQAVRKFNLSRYTPVLAHIERYGCLREEHRIHELSRLDCRFQMNYESLAGCYLNPDTRWCRRQAADGRVHFLATDMHRMDYRSPDTAAARKWLRKHCSRKLQSSMMRRNAQELGGVGCKKCVFKSYLRSPGGET